MRIYLYNGPFTEIYIAYIGLNLLCVMFIIVDMEHVTPINQPPALLILFYSGYEGAGKGIGVHE